MTTKWWDIFSLTKKECEQMAELNRLMAEFYAKQAEYYAARAVHLTKED